ncbi:CBS domain-containing protein [Pseudogemmobacter bohemicus]|uniref:CBS domain-containing protein n=1 Tax=Pseudogemmobacter bohemicus TaxID=2250708 RepID=UPI0018E53DFF|nr:CBS domain-containing protein [Pseudogemmobacter bohemicus]
MLIRSVGEVIQGRDLPQIRSVATITEAASILDHYDIGALVVIDEGRITGLLSERDVLRKVVGQGLHADAITVASAMTPDPVTVQDSDPLADAIGKMESGHFRHLPVVDAAGTCLGLLSVRDIPAEYRVMYERFRALSG